MRACIFSNSADIAVATLHETPSNPSRCDFAVYHCHFSGASTTATTKQAQEAPMGNRINEFDDTQYIRIETNPMSGAQIINK